MTGILISDLLTRRLNPYPASTRLKSNRRATHKALLISNLYGTAWPGSVLARYHFCGAGAGRGAGLSRQGQPRSPTARPLAAVRHRAQARRAGPRSAGRHHGRDLLPLRPQAGAGGRCGPAGELSRRLTMRRSAMNRTMRAGALVLAAGLGLLGAGCTHMTGNKLMAQPA